MKGDDLILASLTAAAAKPEPVKLLVVDGDLRAPLCADMAVFESQEIGVPVIQEPEPEKPSLLRAAMARLDARLNGADRRALRRAQAKVTGKKEGFAAMSARLQRSVAKEKSK